MPLVCRGAIYNLCSQTHGRPAPADQALRAVQHGQTAARACARVCGLRHTDPIPRRLLPAVLLRHTATGAALSELDEDLLSCLRRHLPRPLQARRQCCGELRQDSAGVLPFVALRGSLRDVASICVLLSSDAILEASDRSSWALRVVHLQLRDLRGDSVPLERNIALRIITVARRLRALPLQDEAHLQAGQLERRRV